MITQNDLIGQIRDYPIYIVEMMLANQVAQGNVENISIFQKKADTPKIYGGFDWGKSPEGSGFWVKVINHHIYGEAPVSPVKVEPVKEIPIEEIPTVIPTSGPSIGDTVLCTEGKKTFERIFLAKIEGVEYPYVTVGKKAYAEMLNGNARLTVSCFNNCSLVRQTVKLTRKDISEGKGIGINPELIEIID